MITELPDNDYRLSEGSAWVDVKGITIRIHSTDEGVVVDLYSAAHLAKFDGDFDGALLATTYVYDSDAEVTDE